MLKAPCLGSIMALHSLEVYPCHLTGKMHITAMLSTWRKRSWLPEGRKQNPTLIRKINKSNTKNRKSWNPFQYLPNTCLQCPSHVWMVLKGLGLYWLMVNLCLFFSVVDRHLSDFLCKTATTPACSIYTPLPLSYSNYWSWLWLLHHTYCTHFESVWHSL